MQPPLSSQASQSEAKLLKMLQQRRAAKSQATTPSNLSTSSRDSLTFSTSKRYRINTSLPRLPHFLGSAADIPTGVSAAFLISSLVHCRSKVEQPTTRAAASVLRENGVFSIATLCGRVPHREKDENHPMTPIDAINPMDPPTPTGDFNSHPLTGGPIRGPSRCHVAHAWDASFEALVDSLVKDAGAELDRRYHLDIFALGSCEDVESCPDAERSSQRSGSSKVTGKVMADSPIESLQATVAAVQEVLLILDKDALCFSRLWVLTEAMMAVRGNKLRICSTASLGSTEMDIQAWEERIDGIDWSLATSSRKNDERRLRKFAERVWDMNGIGTDRLLAQLKVALRKYIYGQILVKAVEHGDRKAVEAALERGASPEQRDADGNTLEDLASFCNQQDIEEVLFERRMQRMTHQPLSTFFTPDDLMENCSAADPHVLLPFMTQPVESRSEGREDGLPEEDAEEERLWQVLAGLEPSEKLPNKKPLRLPLASV
eukprot:s412_g7.t1